MSETEGIIEELHRDIMCPGCQYNLRGLRGSVVQCPECGNHCDIAQLISRRWTKPWYAAPGFQRLLIPVTVLGLCSMALFIVAVSIGRSNRMFTTLGMFGVSCAWIFTLIQVSRRGGIEGLSLSLLAHLLFVGYMGGVIGFISSLFITFTVNPFTGIILMVVFCMLVWVSRRGEKFIAQRCIKRYLENKPQL